MTSGAEVEVEIEAKAEVEFKSVVVLCISLLFGSVPKSVSLFFELPLLFLTLVYSTLDLLDQKMIFFS